MKCALYKTIQAFGDDVNFGLATFAGTIQCTGTVCISECTPGNDCTMTNGDKYSNCTWDGFPGWSTAAGCGNFPSCAATGPAAPNLVKGTWRNGMNILVDIEKDSWWSQSPPPPSNKAEMLEYFDGQCGDSKEIFARNGSPIAGALLGVTQYLRAGWTRWSNTDYCAAGLSYTFTTPADVNDIGCRSFNVILLTDGDESCDTQPMAVAAADGLYGNGVTVGNKNWKVKVHVIGIGGGATKANTDAIAAAGGTASSHIANNDTELSNVLAQVISGANFACKP